MEMGTFTTSHTYYDFPAVFIYVWRREKGDQIFLLRIKSWNECIASSFSTLNDNNIKTLRLQNNESEYI